MNPDNYGTPKASQRLVDAGIVLEFEYCWFPDVNSKTGWSLNRCFGKLPSSDCIPATSMAEVWRELPTTTMLTRVFKDGEDRKEGDTIVWDHTKPSHIFFVRTNPADALIDLLIWVVGQRKEKL